MHKGVFVDDEDKVYAGLLSTKGILEFKFLDTCEIAKQAIRIRDESPLVAALDYRLDEVVNNIAADQVYKGSALAQQLRDAAIADPKSDFSIVLVSNEMKLKQLYAPDKTAHDLFDKVYSKEDVENNRSIIQTELVALADGYDWLRSQAPPYAIMDIFRAGDDDALTLDAQELTVAFSHASAPHHVVRIMLRQILERPGILIDRYEASARLGIAADDFGTVAKALEEAKVDYRGILASGWPRWWAHRLEAWTSEILGGRPTSLTANERAAQLAAKFGKLEPARSPWNESSDEFISFACASCRRATELRHSLAAFDPHLPRFSQRRRICWDCIQNDTFKNLASPLLVDETDEALVEDIKKRARKE